MWKLLTANKVLVGLFVLLLALEIGGYVIDYYREEQLKARAEIIILAVTARLEGSRPLNCDEINNIQQRWREAGFDKVKKWEDIRLDGCR